MAIRLLLVDDSETMLFLLQQLVSSDPDFEIVGQARNGRQALALASSQRPDIITMDLLMPEMDGIAAIRQLMATRPVRIVALTTLSAANISFKALEAGALEVLQKPVAYRSAAGQDAMVALLSRLKTLSQVKLGAPSQTRSASSVRASAKDPKAWKLRGIAIAASTGGPPALKTLLAPLSTAFPLPILVIQHISEGFGSAFVEWLNTTTALKVIQATSGMTPEPGKVYLPPDGFHLVLAPPGTIQLSDAPPVQSHRPSANLLFESVGKVWKERSLGIVLTGMGKDGAAGLAVLKQHAGHCLAQDQASCQVFGMPAAAIEAGLADQVLNLEEMGRFLRLLE